MDFQWLTVYRRAHGHAGKLGNFRPAAYYVLTGRYGTPMPKLTKRVVDATTPDANGKDSFLWDSDVKGFGLKVTPTGGKIYVLQYRTADGRSRRYTIGKHGSPWTCDEARGRAMELLRELAAGNDPLEAKAEAKAAMSVKELCALYLDSAEKGMIMGKRRKPKKESTLATDRGRIERHIIPLLGNRKVKDLTTPDIYRFMRDVMTGKTAAVVKTKLRGKAVVEGGTGTATRTVGLLGGILTFAVTEGVIPSNPARGVRRPADNRRDTRLTPDQYRQLGKALVQAGEDGENPNAIAAVWLLALTGCRRGEIENLKWREVDEAACMLRLEDSKEGASLRPVGTDALDVLKTLERRDGCDFALPGRSGNSPFRGLPNAWGRIMAKAKLTGITPHVLRHGHASVGNDLGFTEATIGAIQGRSTKTVTGGYIHHLDGALIAAADRIARHIHELMNGEAERKVVPLPTAMRKRSDL